MDYTYCIEHNTPTLRRPTPLQHHLALYGGPQFANRIERRNFIKNVIPLQEKYTEP